MSTTADRNMPVIDAFWVEALRGEHYRAMFPDGERTYPSKDSMTRAAGRIGCAVRFRVERRGVDSPPDASTLTRTG